MDCRYGRGAVAALVATVVALDAIPIRRPTCRRHQSERVTISRVIGEWTARHPIAGLAGCVVLSAHLNPRLVPQPLHRFDPLSALARVLTPRLEGEPA